MKASLSFLRTSLSWLTRHLFLPNLQSISNWPICFHRPAASVHKEKPMSSLSKVCHFQETYPHHFEILAICQPTNRSPSFGPQLPCPDCTLLKPPAEEWTIWTFQFSSQWIACVINLQMQYVHCIRKTSLCVRRKFKCSLTFIVIAYIQLQNDSNHKTTFGSITSPDRSAW